MTASSLRTILNALVLGLFAITLAGQAGAHQKKAAITEILLNERTGNLEVAHRFVVHDAEHALQGIKGRQIDLFSDEDALAEFVEYMDTTFRIRDRTGALIPLSLLGYEFDRGFLWIYQDAPLSEGMDRLTINHETLRDVWAEQTNTVNIRQADRLSTLTFTGGTGAMSIDLSDTD